MKLDDAIAQATTEVNVAKKLVERLKAALQGAETELGGLEQDLARLQMQKVFADGLNKFGIGDIVLNFGATARVIEIDLERGLLVRDIFKSRDVEGYWETPRNAQQWYADPTKCTLIQTALLTSAD